MDIGWVIAGLMGGTAVIAGVCNCLSRNSLISTTLAIIATLALLYWHESSREPLWPIAAITVVPIVVITCLAVALVAYEIREAFGKLHDEP